METTADAKGAVDKGQRFHHLLLDLVGAAITVTIEDSRLLQKDVQGAFRFSWSCHGLGYRQQGGDVETDHHCCTNRGTQTDAANIFWYKQAGIRELKSPTIHLVFMQKGAIGYEKFCLPFLLQISANR